MDVKTPFDDPRGLVDRFLFPSLRGAYLRGRSDALLELDSYEEFDNVDDAIAWLLRGDE